MRNKRPTVAICDAAPIEKLQHLAHRILRRNCTLEIRCVGRKFARQFLKRFNILRVIGFYDALEGIIADEYVWK